MTPAQAATVLALAAAYDNRTVGEANAYAWAQAIDDRVSLDDAKQIVVEHYAHTREWIMPADINSASAILRKGRLDRMTTPEPPEGLEVTDELTWQRAYRKAVGDGLDETEADRAACAAIGTTRPETIAAPRPVLQLVATAADEIGRKTKTAVTDDRARAAAGLPTRGGAA